MTRPTASVILEADLRLEQLQAAYDAAHDESENRFSDLRNAIAAACPIPGLPWPGIGATDHATLAKIDQARTAWRTAIDRRDAAYQRLEAEYQRQDAAREAINSTTTEHGK